ncbi:MAG TPA: hypothetical protein VK469_08845 [Candidatus Kapabacteria bacterium]|nr:hypothetical protein [Candidatus Kapabacteria bacterium]
MRRNIFVSIITNCCIMLILSGPGCCAGKIEKTNPGVRLVVAIVVD